MNAAQTAAVTDPNAVTIIVGSSETGHGSGIYTENILISLEDLTLESESGYENTIIHAASSTQPAILVAADYVTIGGFSIYGAASSGLNEYAAIELSGADYCIIEKNRCGWQAPMYNNARGIALFSSNLNTIRNNRCLNNTNTGIYLTNSNYNVIAQNSILHNGIHGLELTSTANHNSITQNRLQHNSSDGINIRSDYNQIMANTSEFNNRYGLYAFDTQYNTLFLNKFSGNGSKPLYVYYYPAGVGDTWNSAGPFCYAYYTAIFSGPLGNFYDTYTGTDDDGDGIGQTGHITTNPGSAQKTDLYPLTDPNMAYTMQAWYLAGGQGMTRDPNQVGMWQTLPAGSSTYWLSDTRALEEIEFAAADTQDGWNGRLRFSSAFAGSGFEIEIGFVDPNDGLFIASGAAAVLSGTANTFLFETNAQSFSVPEGMALAARITNHSATERQLYLGGAWSYLSAPSGTQIPWPGQQQQPPIPPVNPGDLNGDGWVDLYDIAYLSAHWGLTGCDEGNDYCQRADINKSGQVNNADLDLLLVYWMMGPGDLLPGDWNEDFKVNMEDMALLSAYWTGDRNDLLDLCESWLKGAF